MTKIARRSAFGVLTGLSIVMSGVCAANAATTSPVTDPVFVVANEFVPGIEILSFPQFNPSLGTLIFPEFSLSSLIIGVNPIFAQVGVINSANVLDVAGITGPFDFTDLPGLLGGLTTANFTGSGQIAVVLQLSNLNAFPGVGIWMSIGPDQGLSLAYNYIPTVTPPPAATPLPATLPLFATGLGALGLLGWFRKRKARASLLGAA